MHIFKQYYMNNIICIYITTNVLVSFRPVECPYRVTTTRYLPSPPPPPFFPRVVSIIIKNRLRVPRFLSIITLPVYDLTAKTYIETSVYFVRLEEEELIIFTPEKMHIPPLNTINKYDIAYYIMHIIPSLSNKPEEKPRKSQVWNKHRSKGAITLTIFFLLKK